jgi:hypothetical protein
VPRRPNWYYFNIDILLIIYADTLTMQISYRNCWGVPVALLWHGAFWSLDRGNEEGCLWPEVPAKYPKPVAELWSKAIMLLVLFHGARNLAPAMFLCMFFLLYFQVTVREDFQTPCVSQPRTPIYSLHIFKNVSFYKPIHSIYLKMYLFISL